MEVWRSKNKEHTKNYNKLYYKANQTKLNKLNLEYRKKKRAERPRTECKHCSKSFLSVNFERHLLTASHKKQLLKINITECVF